MSSPQNVLATDGNNPSIWSVHKTEDGRTYFFNKETKKSVWQKPDELKSESEKNLENSPWSEYKTAENKIYYYNKETKQTTWDIPDEYKKLKDLVESENASKRLSSSELVNTDVKKYSDLYDTIEEARIAFRNLLEEFNIPSSSTYDSAVKLIIEDPRFTALKHNNERKQVFNTYKQHKANEEKEQERKMMRENEDKLLDFLIKNSNLFPSMRFSKASQIFQTEVKWLKVPERNRRDIFNEALKKRERMEKENERKRHTENRLLMKDIFENKINNKIQFITSWDDIIRILEIYIKDTGNAIIPKIIKNDSLDILQEYEAYMRGLIAKREKEIAELKKQEYRTGRKNRQAFWGILKSLHKDGLITKETKWKEVYLHLADNEILNAMYTQKGSNVVDLFKIFIYKLVLREHAERKKHILNLPENIKFYQHLKSIQSSISSKTKYEDVCEGFDVVKEHGYFIFKRFRNKLRKKQASKSGRRPTKRTHNDRKREHDHREGEDFYRSKKKVHKD